MADEIITEIEFREIPGWKNYRVSKNGIVQTRKMSGYGTAVYDSWRTMAQRLDHNSYSHVGLRDHGRRRFAMVHNLILEA
jgi:hypothetical protein